MNEERPAAAPAEVPVVEESRLPANAIVSERAMQQAAATGTNLRAPVAGERRSGVSDLERASIVLAHAVQYLSSEQRAGRCTSVRGNRQAIKMLCECAEGLTRMENREPAREALNTWLAGAKSARGDSSGDRPTVK